MTGRTTRVASWLLVASVFFTACGSSAAHALRAPGGVLRWIPIGLLALLALIVYVRRPQRLHWWHVFWLVLVAWCGASSLWSVAPHTTVERTATLLALAVGIAIGARWFWGTPRGAEAAATALAAGIMLVFVASLVALLDPSVSIQHAWTDAATGGGSAARFRGITENPNTIASYGPVVAPLLAWKIFGTAGRVRALWLGAAVLVVGELAASLSRIPLALVAVELVVLTTLFARRRSVKVAVAGTVCVVAVGLAAASIANTRFGDRVTRATTVATLSGRTAAWHGAANLISEKPVAGYGFGTEDVVFLRYRAAHLRTFLRANFVAAFVHNSYLGAAIQVGVVGAFLFVLLLVAPLALLFASRRLEPRLRVAIMLGLAACAVMAVFSSYIYSVGNVITVATWLLAALPVAVSGRRPGNEVVDRRGERG